MQPDNQTSTNLRTQPGAFRVPEVLNWYYSLLAFPCLEVGNLTFFECFELAAVGISVNMNEFVSADLLSQFISEEQRQVM